jgi:hypothetical protein
MLTNATSGGDLPAYELHINRHNEARSGLQTAHSFQLMKGDHLFLNVVLNSEAEFAEVTPVFSQQQTLTGTVTVNVLEGMHVRSVAIQVCLSRVKVESSFCSIGVTLKSRMLWRRMSLSSGAFLAQSL